MNITIEKIPDEEGGGYCAKDSNSLYVGDGATELEALESLCSLMKFKLVHSSNVNDYQFTLEESKQITDLIVELREQLMFDPELDYDNGYNWENKDGWHLAMSVRSPIDCLSQIVSTKTVYKGDAKLIDKQP